MARPLRVHIPGMQYHVVSRGNEKGCIFADDDDCQLFMELLRRGLARFDVSCISYCLVWNHFHLLLRVGRHSVSRLMQQLNSKYAEEFNRRHQRVGHLVQGRFGSRMVDHGAYTRAVLRYVALNGRRTSRSCTTRTRLGEIAIVVGRSPSTVCRWVHRQAVAAGGKPSAAPSFE